MAGDRRRMGAVVGALAAGAGLSALMMSGERKSGKLSELIALERAARRNLGLTTPPAGQLPSPAEQALAQGGHLLLSAAAGIAYAPITDEESGVVSSGVVFGLAFYAAAHWLVVPLLDLGEPEWREGERTIEMHALNHVLFGLATAVGAAVADR